MKKVTLEQIIEFNPCWLKDEETTAKLYEIGTRKKQWSALDVLSLPDSEVLSGEKLWLVLRTEFIGETVAYDFMCECIEKISSHVSSAKTLSIIMGTNEAKRRWTRGEISDIELTKAKSDAIKAISEYVSVIDAASHISMDAALDAACEASRVAMGITFNSALEMFRTEQVQILIDILNAKEKEHDHKNE